MRRKDREIAGKEAQSRILDQCRVCRIAMQDGEGLYIVPLNFGYCWDGEYPVLYFHGAKKGRKIDAVMSSPEVCVEMDCGHELKEAEEACEYGFLYQSLIGQGRALIVEDLEEKKRALALLMKHQTGKEFLITDQMAGSAEVFKVEVRAMTGKACMRTS